MTVVVVTVGGLRPRLPAEFGFDFSVAEIFVQHFCFVALTVTLTMVIGVSLHGSKISTHKTVYSPPYTSCRCQEYVEIYLHSSMSYLHGV